MTPGRPDAVVLGLRWRARDSELAFVTRSVAGALSRNRPVTVFAPGPAGTTEPDGAFDLVGIGERPEGGWPGPEDVRPSQRPIPGAIWLFDEADDDGRALLESFGGRAAFSVARASEDFGSEVVTLPFTAGSAPEGQAPIGLHVPVNPLATGSRHTGLGFTGYVLVLSDRTGDPTTEASPTAAVAWLTARFYDSWVVVVEGGKASAWKGRALRGVVSVDSRTDLWRLLAHAAVTVDLAPGTIVGRECIESLRFGTPIVVPEAGAAAAHARAGGGLTFADHFELLDAVGFLIQEAAASDLGETGRRYADEYYGDAERFVRRLDGIMPAS